MSTPVTVLDVARFGVCQCSDKIFNWKQDWADSQAAMGPAWSHEARRKRLTVYKAYKAECSLCLSMIKLVKKFPDFMRSDCRCANLKEYQQLTCHMTKAIRADSKVTARYHRLIRERCERIHHQIEKGKAFEHVAAWKAKREAAYAALEAEKPKEAQVVNA